MSIIVDTNRTDVYFELVSDTVVIVFDAVHNTQVDIITFAVEPTVAQLRVACNEWSPV